MIDLNTLRSINHIIENDSTSSTYKYALVKAVIETSQKDSHFLEISGDNVKLPLGLLIEKWFFYYLPFILSKTYQQKSTNRIFDKPTEEAIIDFLNDYAKDYDSKDITTIKEIYREIRNDWNSNRIRDDKKFFKIVKNIARIIVTNPMYYLGRTFFQKEYPIFNSQYRTFGHIKYQKDFSRIDLVTQFGYFEFKKDFYDVFRYLGSSLIGISTINNKWKEGTLQIKKNIDSSNKNFIDELLNIESIDARDTAFIRKKFKSKEKLKCIWTGKSYSLNQIDIDHIIPYSIWGNNDLWNLLPANKKVNQQQKKAKIPNPELLEKCKENIFEYWNFYNQEETIFKSQMEISLTGNIKFLSDEELFERSYFQLINKCEYLISIRNFQAWIINDRE